MICLTLHYGDVIPYLPIILKGLAVSVIVTLVGMILGSLLGIIIYLGKSSKIKFVYLLSKSYIEIIRNTPLLVQLYLMYFGLGQLGLQINPFFAAIIGITINNGAYTAEIFRAGISAVPNQLKEAGLALGLSSNQIFRKIVLLPAIKNVFPSLTNQLILLFLFSSVASIISLEELMYQILNVQTITFRAIEVLSIGGLLYYGCSVLFSLGMKFTERRFFRWGERGF